MAWILALVAVVVVGSILVERNPKGGYRFSRRFMILRDLVHFMRDRKAWWMGPMLIILALLAMFMIASESSAILPFIYVAF